MNRKITFSLVKLVLFFFSIAPHSFFGRPCSGGIQIGSPFISLRTSTPHTFRNLVFGGYFFLNVCHGATHDLHAFPEQDSNTYLSLINDTNVVNLADNAGVDFRFTPSVSDDYTFDINPTASSNAAADVGLFILDNCPEASGNYLASATFDHRLSIVEAYPPTRQEKLIVLSASEFLNSFLSNVGCTDYDLLDCALGTNRPTDIDSGNPLMVSTGLTSASNICVLDNGHDNLDNHRINAMTYIIQCYGGKTTLQSSDGTNSFNSLIRDTNTEFLLCASRKKEEKVLEEFISYFYKYSIYFYRSF